MNHQIYRLRVSLLILMLSAIVLLFSSSRGIANPRGASMKVHATVEIPAIIAVRVYHDMCPYCQQLAPQFKKLTRRKGKDSILYVTLDLSNEASQKQAALLVAALGIQRLWTGDLSNIGTVSFVDGESKKTLSMYRPDGNKSLQQVLQEALEISH